MDGVVDHLRHAHHLHAVHNSPLQRQERVSGEAFSLRFGAYVRGSVSEQAAAGTTRGVVVLLVVRRSPAADADLVPGDVIVSIAGERLESTSDFTAVVERFSGKLVDVEFRRNGSATTASVQLQLA